MLDHLRPGAQPPGGAADQPVERIIRLAVQQFLPTAHHPPQRAEPLLAGRYPAPQLPIPAGHRLDLIALDHQPQVAPAIVGRDAEIAILDIEAADHQPPVVGDRHLLVIADQVAGRPPCAKAFKMRSRRDQRREEGVGRLARSKAIDHQRHGDPAPARRDQRIADQLPAAIRAKNIIIEFKAITRTLDQVDQRLAQRCPLRDEPQPVARQHHADIVRFAVRLGRCRGLLVDRHPRLMPLCPMICQGLMPFSLTHVGHAARRRIRNFPFAVFRRPCLARVTVEDCVDKVTNRFDLVLLAAQRAREISGGAELTVDRDRDKNPVVALREIAEETVMPDELHDSLVASLQKVQIDDDDTPDEIGSIAQSAEALRLTAAAPPRNQNIGGDYDG